MTEKLLVPDIGDFENVEVIEILVKEGQEIEKNDPVVTIESCLLYTSPSPRDREKSRMPSSA